MINHQVTLDFTDIMYLHLKVCLNMARQPVTNGRKKQINYPPTTDSGGRLGWILRDGTYVENKARDAATAARSGGRGPAALDSVCARPTTPTAASRRGADSCDLHPLS